MTEGVPQFRLYYKGTTIKAIAPLTLEIYLLQFVIIAAFSKTSF